MTEAKADEKLAGELENAEDFVELTNQNFTINIPGTSFRALLQDAW